MSHRLAQPARALLCAAMTTLLLAAIRPDPVTPPLPAQGATYTGTVKAVQAGKSIDLITGVGYALRVVRIGIIPATQMMHGSATMRLSDIAPGDIVRTDCHLTEQGLVADRIEKLMPEVAAQEPRP